MKIGGTVSLQVAQTLNSLQEITRKKDVPKKNTSWSLSSDNYKQRRKNNRQIEAGGSFSTSNTVMDIHLRTVT